jgi:hypothetical protein
MDAPTPAQIAMPGFKQIEPMLVATTAHAEPAEADMFDMDRHALSVTFKRGEGWMFYVANNAEELEEQLREGRRPLSASMRQLIERAHALGCCWLLLDADADTVEGIPTHEW